MGHAVEDVLKEYLGAELGDQRRSERLLVIASALEAQPKESFPHAMGSDAALEAFYRFINNGGFSASDIAAPHVAATLERAKAAQAVIAIHDTTHVQFESEREDLGTTTGKSKYGLVAHGTLLLAEQNDLPLGMCNMETYTRSGVKWQKRNHNRRARVRAQDKGRESLRWIRGVDGVEDVKGQSFDVVHVADAEGDFFEFFAHMHTRGARFVVRVGQQERIVKAGEARSVRGVADEITPQTRREAELSGRKHTRATPRASRRRHPERTGRVAQLSVGATRVTLDKTRYSAVELETLELNLVRVWEPEPPEGEPAVEWLLFTSEAIDTAKDLERIVDIYRKRWIIEEYFKALKTGCSLEQRQIESYDALCKVLALFIPIAYRLLLLRGLERIDSQAPATEVFSEIDLDLMAHAPSNRGLPPPRTLADALTHLARLGGHIRNNGRPGWLVLARGYETLLNMKVGWMIANATKTAKKCDQS